MAGDDDIIVRWHWAECAAASDVIESVRGALAARAGDDQAQALSADLEVALDILRQSLPDRTAPVRRAV